MRKLTNNEVAEKLKETKADYLDHVARLEAPKTTIIQSAFLSWDGAPEDSVLGSLYDFDYLHLQELWMKYGIRGQGANVYVIDSGIDVSHVSFKSLGKIPTRAFVPGVDSSKDDCGHGTWVAGKIAAQGVGIAPRCTLSVLRVLDEHGSGPVEATTAALKRVLDDPKADIVNMSLGSPVASPEQEKIINRLADQGVILVAAAGNYDTDTPCYPGSYAKCLAVAATDRKDVKADFSNFGGQIDVAAPGVSCYSTYPQGQFRKLSGTSMAAPIVTGLLTLGISYLKLVKKMTDKKAISALVLKALHETALDLGDKGKDKNYGFGGISGLAFFERLSK